MLVERVDGLASREQWLRAYDEINAFERSLADEGTIIVKLWLHISEAEQLKRFERRAADPLKAWKLTEDDWANRAKRTSTSRPSRTWLPAPTSRGRLAPDCR